MSKIQQTKKRLINFLYRAPIMLWNTFLWLLLHRKSLVLNVFIDQRGLTIRQKNFGDDLNFFLIKELTGKYIFNYNSFFHPKIKNYVCIGSIVEDMTDEKSIIWGGGVMNSKYKDFRKPYRVTATRGPLTQEYLKSNGVSSPSIFGDPALLTPFVYKPDVKKKYSVGIIPHFSELNNALINDFVSSSNDTVLIDLMHYKKWTDVIDLICQCEMVASSSLHGLILSDAYGIPNVWMCINETTGGGEFKFKDYFGGVQRIFERYEVKEKIDLTTIKNYCKNYKGITFDGKALLEACPFLD